MTHPFEPRHHVLAFVALKHVEQRRKYTNEPYLFHLQDVAKMADGKCKFGYEIGLCHDLLEDTDCTYQYLVSTLDRFGYSEDDSTFIADRVYELTDIYTPENYPNANRKERKHLEALRLHTINPVAQTVKYCDIISNSDSILEHDKGFARKYIPELLEVLSEMDKGYKPLYKKALKQLQDSASLI